MSTATTHIDNKPSLQASHCEDEGRSKRKQSQPLAPALRFKDFDGDIDETLFGNHYSFHTTNSLSRDKLNYHKGEVRNIHYGDIHTKFQTHFHLTNEYVPFINEDVDLAKIKEDSYCKVGDLVIADASEDYADIGKSIELIDINNEKLLAGLHTFLASPSSESTALGYMSFLLKSWKLRKQIMTIAQGTKVLSLSARRVSNLKLNLPSLPEQQKIASFLAAVDEKIQQLSKKKALLEAYKKGLMQQLFSCQLRFKDENGKAYPDWEEKRLGEIAEIVGGGTPETVKPDYWDGEIQWFTPTEIRSKYISNSKRTITQSGLSKSSAKLLPAGTILFTSRATIAELGFATQECSTNQGFQSLIVNQNNNSEFIYQLIKVNKNEFVKKSQGSTFLEISSKEMKKMKFNTPILEEQQKIATYLAGIDSKIENVNTQITQTQTFKKGLLQQLFV
jgi:type I restriction enzyme S subunit